MTSRPANPMISLFLSELKNELPRIETSLNHLKEKNESKPALQEFLRSIRQVRAAARIVQCNSIQSLIEAMEACLIGQINAKTYEILARAVRKLKELSLVNPQELEGRSDACNTLAIELFAAGDTIESSDALEKRVQKKMSAPSQETPEDVSMMELFLVELKMQANVLGNGLISLEQNLLDTSLIEPLMRAAHSIKGAARVVHLDPLIYLAHRVEDCLVAAQKSELQLSETHIDALLQAVDIFSKLAEYPHTEISSRIEEFSKKIFSVDGQLLKILQREEIQAPLQVGEGTTLEDVSMMELFTVEVSAQTQVLIDGLIFFENNPGELNSLEPLMRAAHSIKGAARVVHLDLIVHLAHRMEDCFVAAREKVIEINESHIDVLLQAADIFSKLGSLHSGQVQKWIDEEGKKIEDLVQKVQKILEGEIVALKTPAVCETLLPKSPPSPKKEEGPHRIIRVAAENINRLMGLAGEALVESRWLHPFSDSLVLLKKTQNELSRLIENLQFELIDSVLSDRAEHYLTELQHKNNEWRQSFSEKLSLLELFIIRNSNLSDRLYREVVNSRMRPFRDGIEGYPRMVRDLARQMGKKARLEIIGRNTPVDREILEKLEAPLSHLIRNAIDHGIEPSQERVAAGKPPEGTITLLAEHKGGMLAISVLDDGRGVDLQKIKLRILQKNLAAKDAVENLSPSALLEYLFKPGFTTAPKVTEISGRGVGLDVVQNMVKEVAGAVRVVPDAKQGTRFDLQLPLTLSVIRSLLVKVGGEPYAFPLARIDRALMIRQSSIEVVENRQYFVFEGNNIGLIYASQILDTAQRKKAHEQIPVVVISDRHNSYGVIVESFLEERELVVQELDPRLGKIPNIGAGAFMEDGSPVLIFDVEDMVGSIDTLLSGGTLSQVRYEDDQDEKIKERKKILVVDDSITVREVECRLLRGCGYDVDAAVNGMDGWNAARIGDYDLVITDVDMPRMNGIELVLAIKADPRLKSIPVMIVSYKEREGDRHAGLEAGAAFYLTKSSFHDDTLIGAVEELIGKAEMEKEIKEHELRDEQNS